MRGYRKPNTSKKSIFHFTICKVYKIKSKAFLKQICKMPFMYMNIFYNRSTEVFCFFLNKLYLISGVLPESFRSSNGYFNVEFWHISK